MSHIIHRNLTPQNVLIRSSDKVALLGDLFLAKAMEGGLAANLTRPGEVLGDIRYMAPERLEGHTTESPTHIRAFSRPTPLKRWPIRSPPMRRADSIRCIWYRADPKRWKRRSSLRANTSSKSASPSAGCLLRGARVITAIRWVRFPLAATNGGGANSHRC